MAIIEEDGPAQGLQLNIAKSLLHIPVGDPLNRNPLASQETSLPPKGGLDLSIGPSPHCGSTVLKMVKKVLEILTISLETYRICKWKPPFFDHVSTLLKYQTSKPHPTGLFGF